MYLDTYFLNQVKDKIRRETYFYLLFKVYQMICHTSMFLIEDKNLQQEYKIRNYLMILELKLVSQIDWNAKK